MELLFSWKVFHALAFVLLTNTCVFQVSCQCDDASRPLVLNASNLPQYFTSPDYPDNYPPNADCAWFIEAPSKYDRIILNIEEFRSQNNEFLTIYEGADENGTLTLQIDDTNQKSINAFVSSSHRLYFTFKSDDANEQKGFNILFFSNNSANQYACGEEITVTSTEQAFMSPNLPYPFTAADTCDWYFTSTTSNIVFKIKFLDMNSCNPEYLTFYDGNSSDAAQIGQECSTAYTYTFTDIETTSAQAYVEWTVSNETGNYYGFMFTYGPATESLGINLTFPLNNKTVEITIAEDTPTGTVNNSNAVIMLTYTGEEIDLNIDPRVSVTTDEPITPKDTQVFVFDGTQPVRYLFLASGLDYETINKFSLLVTLFHPDIPEVTYSVTFNVTITDVDDISPTFTNLPYNDTLKRTRKKGYHLYTVNATDGDGTAENRVITYDIFFGNGDGIFTIDEVSGEITLTKSSNQVPVSVLQYDLTIVAYSGSDLGTFETFTVYVDPDNPPECTHSVVWAEMLDINTAGTGTSITLLEQWSCSDDNNNVTYTIESVTPNVTTPLFKVNASTGDITLLRQVDPSEVANRQFLIEIGVTDSIGQTVIISLYLNVTALSCLPNPRNLYVRMDQVIDGVILSDFNCTITQGLRFSLKQYPAGTFAVTSYTNGNAALVLKASVVKIKFYSLSITITDGVDIAVLKFKVIIQTKRCGIANGAIPLKNALQDNIVGFIVILFGTSMVFTFLF